MRKCAQKYIMVKSKKFIVVIFLFIFSCSDINDNKKYGFKELDILNETDITITKANQKVVNAVSKKLFKDETQIYLKADYINNEIVRRDLLISMSYNPNYNNIINLANALHSKDGNIKADFFNEMNTLSSVLYADSAQISNRYNNMIAKGHVVIYSPETNLMLLGDEVLWDNNAKRILSDKDVTILKKLNDTQCIQKSKGFESDMNLSNYIFYEIEGKINENCF